MGYFAGRAAPMGQVGPGAGDRPPSTTSLRRWWHARYRTPGAFASVDQVLDARLKGVHEPSAGYSEIVRLAARSPPGGRSRQSPPSMHTDPCGRPLFAANSDLSVPDEPHLRLWWALTCLREHRGDGHVAALVHAGHRRVRSPRHDVGSGAVDARRFNPTADWTDEEWSHASDRLRARGWVDDGERLTSAGRDARQQFER